METPTAVELDGMGRPLTPTAFEEEDELAGWSHEGRG